MISENPCCIESEQRNLKLQFPSQGWKQILTARKEMLDAYDNARVQARAHEVETYHGNVAEAICRKWLSKFLPKKYGVTSGYIVSPGQKDTDKVPHYDVIIYDQLESPILWVEGNPDNSSQGRSMAIPVEYVLAVFEVKSSFSTKTIKASIEHLQDLQPIMSKVDLPDDLYKIYLPKTFFCGIIFFELRENELYNDYALDEILKGIYLRGFIGGIILRANNHSTLKTGRIVITKSETKSENTVKNYKLELSTFSIGNSIEIEKKHIGTLLSWSELEFSKFAFDIIALIQGKFKSGYLSSWYCVGSSWHETDQK